MLVSKTIPNLINGVSQQPDSLRFATQCEAQENAYPSVVDGLTKRLPTEHLLNTGITGDAKTFVHTINRDETERYSVVIRDQSIKVFDLLNLNEETVDKPDGVTYLDTDNADTAFRAVTIADVTFIVNTETTVAMATDDTPSSASTYEALVFIKQGGLEGDYKIEVDDGTTQVSSTINASSSTTSSAIATAFATDVDEGIDGEGNFTAVAGNHVIYITNTADFDINVSHTNSDTAIEVFKGSCQRFTDLPTYAKDGIILKVEGEPTETLDDYYVKFVTLGAAGSIGEGTWEECAAPALNDGLKFNAATMPHVLIRQADNTFVFKKADGATHDSYDYSAFSWGNRLVGDFDTNPDPSFVGQKINDVFLFKNRLGFLASDNTILSESGEFFNFFRTTVVDLLDTAPIDVASAHNRVAVLRHAVPLAQRLILFSDTTQFILQGGDTLTPKTVSIAHSTSYDCLLDCPPVSSGSSVMFPFNRGSFSGVREYVPKDSVEDLFDGLDISAHVPKYIPGKITKIAAATHESVLACMADGDTDALYIYNYYVTGDERLQSAWHRFEFGTGSKILGIDFIDTDLYMVVHRSEGVFIEKLAFELGKSDPDSSYMARLDRRTTLGTIDVTGKIITLPYQVTEGRTDIEVVTKTGARVPLSSQPSVGDTTITLRDAILDIENYGNLTETTSGTFDFGTLGSASSTDDYGLITDNIDSVGYYLGESYEMTYQMSDVTMKEPSPGGGRAVITDGRAQIRYGTLVYADSSYFSVDVTQDHRDTSSHVFAGRVLGSALTLGEVPLESGEFRFPVFSKADQVTITIKNDSPLPSNLMSAEFELNWSPRAQRIGL
ncbi:MAG: putative tail tubular protein [Prokaryotic dsDNA virus sp.]|nr:MAG: putative tail tubular protein [Prokaryotic dsDNA virus sp.]|tara:strand:- start:20828 stop:23338 length:2511 start_codon:yes stop_codon:yes gene_type:complete